MGKLKDDSWNNGRFSTFAFTKTRQREIAFNKLTPTPKLNLDEENWIRLKTFGCTVWVWLPVPRSAMFKSAAGEDVFVDSHP